MAAALAVVAGMALGSASPSPVAASEIQVNAAEPAFAPQGTLNLDVEIRGSGFDQSAVARFLIAGSNDAGGVRVNATTYRGPRRLIANVDVAADAFVGQFDILVEQRGGRTGKGTELFSVVEAERTPPFTEDADLTFENRENDAILGSVDHRIQLSDGHPMSELGLVWIDFGSPGNGPQSPGEACANDSFSGTSQSIEVTLTSTVLTLTSAGEIDALQHGLFGLVEGQEAQASVKWTWWALDGEPIPLAQRFATLRGHKPVYWNEQWSLRLDGTDGSTLATVRRLPDAACGSQGRSTPCWRYEISAGDSARLVCVPPGKGGLDHKNAVRHSLHSVPTAFGIEALP